MNRSGVPPRQTALAGHDGQLGFGANGTNAGYGLSAGFMANAVLGGVSLSTMGSLNLDLSGPDVPALPVAEPASLALLGFGLITIAIVRRRI